MDFSSFGAAASAITAARELGRAMVGVRDFNEFATTVSQLNDKLLKAQESLFTLNTLLLDLHSKYFEACEELRKAKEAIKQRNSYSLVELGTGTFVYQKNITVSLGEVGEQTPAEPMHYVCQRCFDSGFKSVLQRSVSGGIVHLRCLVCTTKLRTGESGPRNGSIVGYMAR